MATLTSVPVTLPESKIPTNEDIRDIVGTFLNGEWPSADPAGLTVSYNASYSNAHCFVERPGPATGVPSEPLKVFIKFHNDTLGVLEGFKHIAPSKQEEAIFCYEYGRLGLGPQVHGFFKTQDGTFGRVDEFLDARNMEPGDVEDSSIRADIAKGMANFHVLKPSMDEKKVDSYYEVVIGGLKKYHRMDKLKALGKAGGVDMDNLVDYDFGTRLRKVVDRLESMGAKLGWCIHDVQFMNVMLKNHPQEGDSKVALIDFEFTMLNYRAFDIGGHFMQKMFKWFDEDNKIVDCRKYTEQEKRHFCEEYTRQWNQLTGDSDTAEQICLEAEYGYMLAITFDVHNMLCFMSETGDKDPLNLRGLQKLLDEFEGQFIKLGLDK